MTAPSRFATRVEQEFRKAAGLGPSVPVCVEILDDESVFVIVGHRNIFIGDAGRHGQWVFVSTGCTVTIGVPADYPEVDAA